jgi:hypothetical protein
MKKQLVSKQVEEARGNGPASKTPSAHAVLRAQGVPEAKARAGGDNVDPASAGSGRKKQTKSKKAPARNVPAGGYTKCENGHELRLMRTPHDEYICDGCDAGFIKKGAQMFGCRICDWDACSKCTAPAVVTAELVREAAEDKVMQEGKGKEATGEGRWMWARKVDAYKNRFMQIRHTGSGVVAEIHHYSVGQFTLRPGRGAKSYCIAETGEVLPFQLCYPDLESELAEGGGQPFPSQGAILGNWKVRSSG